MSINDAVQLGWEYSAKHAGGTIGAFESSEYIAEVTDAIQKLNDDINFYAGRTDGVGTLKGFMAEEWHADTFNLNAILRGSANRAMRDDSNKHASVDISTNFGESYSLKYYATGADSAKAQAKNVIEAYYEYCRKPRQGEPLSFEQYLDRYGYSEKDIYTSVYYGQGRIIPSDQLQTEAIEYLKRKIAEDSMSDNPTRIAVMQARLETLQRLSDRIKDSDGVESIPLTKEEAEAIAALAKEGAFDAEDFGISIDIISRQYILKEAMKAGLTAAVITLIMQLVPELFKTISYLIKNGEIDLDQLKASGKKALSATASGFIRGSVAYWLTYACRTGKFGAALQNTPASVIGAVVVVLMDAVVNSYRLSTGKITAKEFGIAITKDILMSAASIGGGILGQTLLPELPVLGYLLGSFIGSVLAGVSIEIADRIIVSICVKSGFTCFGLVDQDYTLPEEVLDEIGIERIDLLSTIIPEVQIEEIEIETIGIEETEVDTVEMCLLKRGLIGVKKVGYSLIN